MVRSLSICATISDAKWVASLQVKPNIRSIFSADMFQQFDELKMCDPTRDDAIGYSDFASHVLC